VQDLSHLAENSLTATSQGAGNMMSSNATAMTAPGSQPVTPLPPTRDQDTPNLTEPTGDAAQVSIGVAGPARGATSGKPAGARAAAASTINAVPGGSDS